MACEVIYINIFIDPGCSMHVPPVGTLHKGLMKDAREAEGTFETPPTCCLGANSLDLAPQPSWWLEVADATTLPGLMAPEAAISPGLGSARLWTL